MAKLSNSIYKKLIGDIGLFSFFNLLVGLSGLFLLPVITKNLGAEDYGLYVQFTVSITLIVSVATLGLPYSLVRFLAGEKDTERIQGDVWASIVVILLTSLFITLLVVLFSKNISESLFGGYSEIVIILSIILPIECVSISLQNVFRVFQKIKEYTILNLIRTYTELALIIWVIFIGAGIINVTRTILVVRFIFLIIFLFFIISLIGIGKPRFEKLIEYIKFGLPTVPANFASWINDSSDRYIIAFIIGVIFVGYYSPAYILGSILFMMSLPFDFVLVSVSAEYYNKGNIPLVREIFRYSIKYYLMLAIPSFFGITLLSKPLLNLLTTTEIANQSYFITPLIALAMVFGGIGAAAIGKSLFLAKRNDIVMINWFLVALINIILCILLVPKMGILGAGIGTLLSFSFGFFFGSYYSVKYFEFDIDWMSILKIFIASLVISVLILFFYPKNLSELIFTVLLSIGVYIALILAMKTFDDKEVTLIKSFVR